MATETDFSKELGQLLVKYKVRLKAEGNMIYYTTEERIAGTFLENAIGKEEGAHWIVQVIDAFDLPDNENSVQQ